MKHSRSSADLDFLGVNISSYIISFRFFADFRTLAELRKTKIGRFEAGELAVTGEKLFNYLKRKDF